MKEKNQETVAEECGTLFHKQWRWRLACSSQSFKDVYSCPQQCLSYWGKKGILYS